MLEKKVNDAIQFRRSVRIFDPKKEIDPKIVKDCIAYRSGPNSSNLHRILSYN